MGTISQEDYIQAIEKVIRSHRFSECVRALTGVLVTAWIDRKNVFVAGNGGSGATASHFAGDLSKAVALPRAKREAFRTGIKAICANDNNPLFSAIGNDVGYDHVFSGFLSIFAQPGDVFVALSGSGNSTNILMGLGRAQEIGMLPVAIIGCRNGEALKFVRTGFGLCLPHPDIRGMEDLQSILCHTVIGELKRIAEEC